MRIQVKLFAALREAIDRGEFVEELPPASTLRTLVECLSAQYPVLGDHLSSLHFAVNHHYAALDVELQDGDEVAFLPPVGGG